MATMNSIVCISLLSVFQIGSLSTDSELILDEERLLHRRFRCRGFPRVSWLPGSSSDSQSQLSQRATFLRR
jgi:hypothetical protein